MFFDSKNVTNDSKRAATFLTDRNLGFPQLPQIASDLNVFHMPDGLGVQVRGGESNLVLRGELAQTIIPWLFRVLDGSRTAEQVLTERPAGASESQVLDALLLLFIKGLICESSALGPSVSMAASTTDIALRRQLLFWGRKLGLTRASRTAEEVQIKLESARIVLVGNGLFGTVACDVLSRSGCRGIVPLDFGEDGHMAESLHQDPNLPTTDIPVLGRSLEATQAHLETLVPSADLIVTATVNAPEELFALINELCLFHKTSWLRANDDSEHIEIGPYVVPGDSGCFTCMRLLQSSVDDLSVEAELYERHLASQATLKAGLGECLSLTTAAAGCLSTEAIRILTLVAPPVTENAVLTMSIGGTFVLDSFLRVPRCPDCHRGKSSVSILQATAC